MTKAIQNKCSRSPKKRNTHRPLTHKKAKKSSVSGLPAGKHCVESLPAIVEWMRDGSDLLGGIPNSDLYYEIEIGHGEVTSFTV